MRVVGVDGCPGGWLAMVFDGVSLEPHFHPTFSELVQRYSDVRLHRHRYSDRAQLNWSPRLRPRGSAPAWTSPVERLSCSRS